jgi:hypothetical protein
METSLANINCGIKTTCSFSIGVDRWMYGLVQ